VCLAIPGKILSCSEQNGVRIGRVEFAGIIRETCLDLVPEASLGDYVLVHVGFAMSVVDREEAERTYALLELLGLLQEELGAHLEPS